MNYELGVFSFNDLTFQIILTVLVRNRDSCNSSSS